VELIIGSSYWVCSVFETLTVHSFVRLLEELSLLLTQGTVLYGELIQRERGSPSRVLNIIDAAMIGHDDIRQWNLSERRVACKRFAMDMDAPFNLECRVICSDLMRLIDLPAFLAE
jgi:hypothetical protein